MNNKLTCMLIALFLILQLSPTYADEPTAEGLHITSEFADKVVEYQIKWDQLNKMYRDEMTSSEQFICWAVSDALSYLLPDNAQPVFDAIDSIDSLERMRDMIGNGVIDFDAPFEHDESVLRKAQGFLTGSGHSLPEGMFILCRGSADGSPDAEKWWAQYGHIRFIEEFGERLLDVVQEGQLLLQGTDRRLVYFGEGGSAEAPFL